jgi:hypothetical protein
MPAKQMTGRVARPVKVLVPLIKAELEMGDAAGLEHYRRAGEMLIEAREQVVSRQWGTWLSKNFALSRSTAWRYMRLAEQPERVTRETSLRQVTGVASTPYESRTGEYRPIRDFTARVPAERLSQDRQTMGDEIRLHREVALQLIEIGYRALATRLHPDRGGSKEAMARLNRVREELKAVAETRRFL